MAYELVEEVLDHAPAMGATERLVLVCIAEECRRAPARAGVPVRLERRVAIPGERMQRRTGLSTRGLRHAYERLEALGLNVRVILRLDRHGEPVYAVPGKTTVFELPAFDPPPGCPCDRCAKADPDVLLPEKEDEQGRQADVEGRQADVEGNPGGRTGPPFPSGDPYGVSPDHAHTAAAALDALPDDAVIDRQSAMAVIRLRTGQGLEKWRPARRPR